MAISGIPIRIGDYLAVRNRTTSSLAAGELIKPMFEARVVVSVIQVARLYTANQKHRYYAYDEFSRGCFHFHDPAGTASIAPQWRIYRYQRGEIVVVEIVRLGSR